RRHTTSDRDWSSDVCSSDLNCQLARTLPASYPVLVHRLASLLRASFRPRLAAGVISPLRFAITSPPSGCEEDLHLQAVDHARHTDRKSVGEGKRGTRTIRRS